MFFVLVSTEIIRIQWGCIILSNRLQWQTDIDRWKWALKLPIVELQIKNRAQSGVICSSKWNEFELELVRYW